MKNNKPVKKKRWRIRVVPSFTVKIVTSERAARKELNTIAERLYKESMTGSHNMLFQSILIETSESDEWDSYLSMNRRELLDYYRDEVLAQ